MHKILIASNHFYCLLLISADRSQSRTAMAVERFLYNLTRPTDQRHQPVPKKRDSSSVGCLPAYLAPALGDKKGGKMKVGDIDITQE